ncbi:mechanosensitive ion channel domain-containing protein [Microbulbifer sp. SAOS-129_SWC]|uniref:mechanosensitive ion channel domain-containing protein n=1 Tax=Microbulbifer sp. SAOS-129_SWC TaxID=3145235 RepID=UPI003216C009
MSAIGNFLLLSLFIACAPLAAAQSPLPASGDEPKQQKPEATAPFADLKGERERVEAHIEEATTQLNAVKAALDTADGQRADEEKNMLQQQLELLQTRLQTGRRHLKLLDDEQALRDARERLQQQSANWSGFEQAPPYPNTLLATLQRKLNSEQAAIKTVQTRLASLEENKSLTLEGFDKAAKATRQTLEALESAPSPEDRQQARRENTLAGIALAMAGENIAYLRARAQNLKERQALHQLRANFLQQQLTEALADTQISASEAREMQEKLRRAQRAAQKALDTAGATETDLSEQYATLFARVDRQRQQGKEDTLLNRALQLRQQQLETSRATIDDINLQLGYLQVRQRVWEQRLALQQNWDFTEAKSRLKQVDTLLKLVQDGIASLELARAETVNFTVEPRFDEPELAAARHDLIETVDARKAQLETTLRDGRRLADTLRLMRMVIETRIGDMGAGEWARGWKEMVVAQTRRLWSYELMSVEDTLVVDGERIVEQRPITLGKVLLAIAILVIGLIVASRLARIISRIVLPFSGGKWQSQLLVQKLLRIGLIALVVVLSLVTVKIPLTVFAFLGGAIALGLGFGAQNLINNFISGFILLSERPIRAGDRIEIEGTRGIVDSIGDRCTRIRRFDGVEILIPNSQFLERSVTNITLSDQRMRTSIRVGVTYGSATREVHALLLEIAAGHALVLDNPEPTVVFEDFGDNALIFSLFLWIDLVAQGDYRSVLTDLRHSISERFAERGIAMAFPQRDLHFDSTSPLAVRLLGQPED